MSARPHVYVSRRKGVDGGKSPNQYFPQVTAEIRVFYPTYQLEVALEELDKAYDDAREQLMERLFQQQTVVRDAAQ